MMPTEMPTRATVAAQLQASLAALHTAERALLVTTLGLADARRILQWVEDRHLLADPPILDGKNEIIRAAQLRACAVEEREQLTVAEDSRTRAASALERAKAELATWRAISRLVGGEDR